MRGTSETNSSPSFYRETKGCVIEGPRMQVPEGWAYKTFQVEGGAPSLPLLLGAP